MQLYSSAGQILYSTITGGSSGGGSATRYVYLGQRLIAETKTANGASSTRYIHTDGLGSPVAHTDSAGTVVDRSRYEAYGANVNIAGSTNPVGIGFTGHVHDVDTGLIYMQQRYYDPIAGRFLSTDQVLTDTSSGAMFNRYVYVNNNPYRYTDPDGNDIAELLEGSPLAAIGKSFGGLAAFVEGLATGNAGLQNTAVQGMDENRAENISAIAVIGSMGRAGPKSGIQANRAAGEAFEKQILPKLQETQTGVVQQVTIKTESGIKTRLDFLGVDKTTGQVKCTECKASETAPLTPNQKSGFPEIQKSGGTVVGKGKPGFPKGTKIPPTKVDIIRPEPK